jgi:hypothetical protein
MVQSVLTMVSTCSNLSSFTHHTQNTRLTINPLRACISGSSCSISTPHHSRRDSKTQKRRNNPDIEYSHTSRISFTQHNSRSNLHASTHDSDLWILPDFDEWEADAQSPQLEKRSAELAPLFARAANTNRERLRRRLEGDGWDFVGGKYGEDGKTLQDVDVGSDGSVDEEFDVVVLNRGRRETC